MVGIMGHSHAADILSVSQPSTTKIWTPCIVLDNTPVTVSTKREIVRGLVKKWWIKWRKQNKEHLSQGLGSGQKIWTVQLISLESFTSFHIPWILWILARDRLENDRKMVQLFGGSTFKDSSLFITTKPCSIWYRVLWVNRPKLYPLCYKDPVICMNI